LSFSGSVSAFIDRSRKNSNTLPRKSSSPRHHGNNTDDAVGGIVQQVSMDSIQEFQVVTSRAKAEHSRS
jgi:hypothetical protein